MSSLEKNLAKRRRRKHKHVQRQIKNKQITASFGSIFDAAPTRSHSKFNIIGQRKIGGKRNVSESRMKALAQRQDILLEENRKSGKSNQFIDRRFGEKSGRLSLDEKILKRFQKERLNRFKKKSKFILEDEDTLTLGQYLSRQSRDDDDDDEESRRIDEEMVRQLNFGGGQFDQKKDGVKKTKREVMYELIAKSKAHKMLRQEKIAEQAKNLQDMNADFADIRGILNFEKDNLTKKPNEKDDYMVELRRMEMEARQKAVDRAETPEEIAKKNLEKLELLEEKRLRRMDGDMSSDTEHEEDQQKKKKEDSKNQKYNRTDDDLGTNFTVDKKFQYRDDDSDDDYDNDNDNDNDNDDNDDTKYSVGIIDDDDDNDDDDDDGDDNNDNQNDIQVNSGGNNDRNNKKQSNINTQDIKLPFIFNAPNNLKELKLLLKDHATENHGIIMERIITCNHISLASENRQKIERFYGILLLYFRSICRKIGKLQYQENKKQMMLQLDQLSVQFWNLTQLMPQFACEVHRHHLSSMRKEFLRRLKNDDHTSVFPSFYALLYLKLITHLFPTSDARHGVTTPAMLFMAECISKAPVRYARDVAAGLFICALILQFIKDSKRLVPELLKFLNSTMKMLVSLKSIEREEQKEEEEEIVQTIKKSKKNNIDHESCKINIRLLFFSTEKEEIYMHRISLLHVTLNLVEMTTKTYATLASLPEIITPIAKILSGINTNRQLNLLSPTIQSRCRALLDEMNASMNRIVRERLPVVQSFLLKPNTIKQHDPAFIENYVPGKDYNLNKELVQVKKLKKKVKREKKGAIKKLREDTLFLAKEKARIQAFQDNKRIRKVKEIMTMLQEEQRDTNLMARMNKKQKRKKEIALLRGDRMNDDDD